LIFKKQGGGILSALYNIARAIAYLQDNQELGALLSKRGIVLWANDRAADILERTPAELRGLDILDSPDLNPEREDLSMHGFRRVSIKGSFTPFRKLLSVYCYPCGECCLILLNVIHFEASIKPPLQETPGMAGN